MNALGRIVKQTGYGLAQPWEGRNIGLSDDDQASLQREGVMPDYTAGNQNFLTTANAAIIRLAAQAGDILWNTPAALAGGLTGLFHQTAEEIAGSPSPTFEGTTEERTRQILAAPFGMIGDIASGVNKGYYGELPELGGEGAITTEAARVARASDAAAARAVGAIGEGEAGYYDAAPLTPETATARTAAAQEAGIEAPQPNPPPPDVHSLARRIDPETFQEYDALNAEGAIHRARLAAMAEERAASPEAVAAQGQIDTIMGRVNNVPSRLTNAARGRLEAAQATLDEVLSRETPEMAATRAQLLDADFAKRDLAVDVSAAYRQAREIAPDLPETAPAEQPTGAAGIEAEGAPQPAADMVARSEEEARTTAAGAATEAQPAEFRAPDVLGGEAAVAQAEEGAALSREQARASGEGAPTLTEQAAQPAGAEEGEPAKPGGTEVEKPGLAKYGNLRAVEGTGETVARGLSAHVEEDAIERGLANSFGDLPEYERVSMADQARQAAELMDRDYDTAKEIAMGTRQPPKGLLPESVYVGVEKRATAEGDVETLRALATRSRLNTTATTMGQRIRTLGERDRTSPVGAIAAVQQAREAAFSARGASLEAARAATVAEIRAEARAAASKPDAWEALVSSLLCK